MGRKGTDLHLIHSIAPPNRRIGPVGQAPVLTNTLAFLQLPTRRESRSTGCRAPAASSTLKRKRLLSVQDGFGKVFDTCLSPGHFYRRFVRYVRLDDTPNRHWVLVLESCLLELHDDHTRKIAADYVRAVRVASRLGGLGPGI